MSKITALPGPDLKEGLLDGDYTLTGGRLCWSLEGYQRLKQAGLWDGDYRAKPPTYPSVETMLELQAERTRLTTPSSVTTATRRPAQAVLATEKRALTLDTGAIYAKRNANLHAALGSAPANAPAGAAKASPTLNPADIYARRAAAMKPSA